MRTWAFYLLSLAAAPCWQPTAKADEDRRDHDWNDSYWHEHHYGYWHGQRGYWKHHHHHHDFIQVGPVTIEH
ncbi:MAG: hypothetical protein JO069_10045 [Verrucomicrobia bacterium]|nr:hypothetical protein [Verrucomicrobiota bacterium]